MPMTMLLVKHRQRVLWGQQLQQKHVRSCGCIVMVKIIAKAGPQSLVL